MLIIPCMVKPRVLRGGSCPTYVVDVHSDEFTFAKALAADALHGLTSVPKSLPPKYFYDAVGSALFDRITELPEYYLTRAEDAILAARAPELMREISPDDIVELGAGYATKSRRLLDARPDASRPLRYVPVDVDAGTMATAAERLLRDYAGLEVHGVVGDFERHLVHVPPPRGRRLVVFLGSTIGNLHPPARHELLTQVRGLMRPGDRFLLGIDLVKDRAVIEAAYDDAAGVTADFNRNVLDVLNRVLDGDFRPAAFRHHAFFDAATSRVEMHLVARTRQTARLAALGLTVDVAAGESIWTESSYKFTRAAVTAMLEDAGLGLAAWYTDADERFALALAG
jgi:L-histidine Nalpha-methyltransferase